MWCWSHRESFGLVQYIFVFLPTSHTEDKCTIISNHTATTMMTTQRLCYKRINFATNKIKYGDKTVVK